MFADPTNIIPTTPLLYHCTAVSGRDTRYTTVYIYVSTYVITDKVEHVRLHRGRISHICLILPPFILTVPVVKLSRPSIDLDERCYFVEFDAYLNDLEAIYSVVSLSG